MGYVVYYANISIECHLILVNHFDMRTFQELFVMYLTKLAQRHGDNDQRVDYKDLAAVVQRKVNKNTSYGFPNFVFIFLVVP